MNLNLTSLTNLKKWVRHFRIKYIFALSVVGVFFLSYQIYIQKYLKNHVDEIETIHIAENQNTLNQKINLSLKLFESNRNEEQYAQIVLSNYNEFKANHLYLVEMSKELRKNDKATSVVKNNLMYTTLALKSMSTKLADLDKIKKLNKTQLNEIYELNKKLEVSLQTTSEQINASIINKINKLKAVELGLLIFMFFVLVLEAFIIFFPAEKKVKILTNDVKSLFTRLNIARDIALKAAKAKSQFLANMSHEIRTPLNAIVGISSILDDSNLNDEQQNHVNILKNSGETLLYLVNDILDSSKLDVGEVKLEEVPFKLSERINGVLDIFAPSAYKKGIELTSVLDPSIDQTLIGDPTRLTQIVSNIVSNAIKFTKEGHVTIQVSKEEDDFYKIIIKDTGIGIPQEAHANIFDKFTQADVSTTRKFGGTGLGLSICKDLTKLMKGSIRLESEVGVGTCFIILLPFKQSNVEIEETGLSYQAIDSLGKKILIVDGLEANLENMKKYALDLGLDVCLADSRNEAEKYIYDRHMSFDIIVADYNSPFIKGLEFCKSVKADGHQSTKFINILYPTDERTVIEKVKAENFEILTKPLKYNNFYNAIYKSLGAPRLKLVSEEDTTITTKTGPLNILLVDDDASNRLIVKMFCKSKPCWHIDEAENGEICCEMIKQKKYDLVILDMQMPVMGGIEATQHIRKWEQENDIPAHYIVALTANVIPEQVQQCLDAGYSTHLGKPIKKDHLLSFIENFAKNELKKAS